MPIKGKDRLSRHTCKWSSSTSTKAKTRVPKGRERQVQAIDQELCQTDPEVEEFTMFKVGGQSHEPIVAIVTLVVQERRQLFRSGGRA